MSLWMFVYEKGGLSMDKKFIEEISVKNRFESSSKREALKEKGYTIKREMASMCDGDGVLYEGLLVKEDELYTFYYSSGLCGSIKVYKRGDEKERLEHWYDGD